MTPGQDAAEGWVPRSEVAEIVQKLDAEKAEAVKERDAEVERLMIIIDGLREGEHEARCEERQHCIDVCESIGAGYVGTGQAVAKQIAQTLRPPASAPEGEK